MSSGWARTRRRRTTGLDWDSWCVLVVSPDGPEPYSTLLQAGASPAGGATPSFSEERTMSPRHLTRPSACSCIPIPQYLRRQLAPDALRTGSGCDIFASRAFLRYGALVAFVVAKSDHFEEIAPATRATKWKICSTVEKPPTI
ncbi:hypothetical protein MKEN_00849700 [Mycena kentingensis (nom. inval.)]|nr:hypothetical protein MKEN_00849700 [Mycena kentingensis (nom. inval.)]